MKPNGQTRRARGPEHAADPAKRVHGPFEGYGRTYAQEAGTRPASRGPRCRHDESAARMPGDGAASPPPSSAFP